MKSRRLAILVWLIAVCIVASIGIPPVDAADEPLSRAEARRLFATEVKPLLQKKCFGCHGDGDELESGFDMRTRRGMLRGGEIGPALVPGDADKSALYNAVLRTGDLVMPPKDRNKLMTDEIALLRRWIEAGAPWDSPGADDDRWSKYEPEDLWAFQPIKKPVIPVDDLDVSQVENTIDAFIVARLRAAGVSPAATADHRTLIRRATYDLTGLPPTADEIEAFVADERPDAFERLVDRLLASPRYGERWGRHWLDVVRYADTAGFSNDYERPNAWRYRDYVIRSFNADKPYNRFAIEQLAGDELYDMQLESDPELLIAAGYLRMGPWEQTGMSVKAVTRQHFLDDVTNSVGVTFLAMGLRCARCHDHKFDPIPTRDYYRMQAIFSPVQFADREVPYQSVENTSHFAEGEKRAQLLLDEAEGVRAAINKKRRDALTAFLAERGIKDVKELPAEERPKRHYGLTPLEMGMEKIYAKRRDYFQRELKRFEPFAMGVYNGPANNYVSNRVVQKMEPFGENARADEVFVLTGGALNSPAEKVEPGTMTAVAVYSDDPSSQWGAIPGDLRGRRLALAQWIASERNPLTARVIVNRVWQYHFGNGIAQNANNFGKMGKKPTHPELLDWLAADFIEQGWSIKQLHRLIMTSATYQRSADYDDIEQLQRVDPSNDLLAHFPPRRLTAEELRDSMLAASGELNLEMGGPGIYPEIHWEVALQPRHIMGSVAPAYQPSRTPDQRNRRTIYAFIYRTLPDPMLEVFNQPGSEVSCERRDETTVTPQVFSLLNGQAVHNRALALANRVAQSYDDLQEQVSAAFRLVFGREPSEEELERCVSHVRRMTEHHRSREPSAAKMPTKVTRAMIEELTGEAYTWDEELDVMNDYVPDLSRADVGPATRALADLCLVLLNSNEFVYVY